MKLLKCKMCGYEAKALHQHVKYKHNLSGNEYKKKYNVDKLQILTEEQCKMRSEIAKSNWKNIEYRNKMLKKLNITHNSDEVHSKISNSLKIKYHTGEIYAWNKGLTKDDDERIKHVGEVNSKKLRGRKNPKHSKLMKELWNNLKENNPDKLERINDKRKKTISEKIASGKMWWNSNVYKNGWYEGKHDKYYYFSSLELEAMIFFDTDVRIKKWTNKHGITIPYIKLTGQSAYYIPDFYIELNDGRVIIIETKGKPDENLQFKQEATSKLYDYYVCYSVEEIDRILNEKCKN